VSKSTGSFHVDASVFAVDARWNVLDRISYRKLKGFDGLVRHSGDDRTGGGEGDDETITFDLFKLPQNVQCFLVILNSFTGQSLRLVNHAYIRVVVNGVTVTSLGLFGNKVDNDAWKRGDRTLSNPFSIADGTGLLFGLLFRHLGEWAFGSIIQPADGRTCEDSWPLAVYHAQQAMPLMEQKLFQMKAAQAPMDERRPLTGTTVSEQSEPEPSVVDDPMESEVYSDPDDDFWGGLDPVPQTPSPPPPQASAGTTMISSTDMDRRGSFCAPPPPGMATSWSVDQVVQFVEGLGLGHMVESFRENAIDGPMLVDLSEADLCDDLSLTKLQAKKVLARLPK